MLSIGLIVLIVHGEAESCTIEEKKWIAHVVLNRLRAPEQFRSIEDDFKGLKRKMKIENRIERMAFIESIDAVIQAILESFINIDPTHGAVFFATKKLFHNKDPSSVFGAPVVEVETPEYFQHRFFKLKGG